MSHSPSRRLTVRRGSVSAPDPLGINAALNYGPNRSSSSTLTIVRVVDPASPTGLVVAPPNLSDSPSSPTHNRRSFRRHGSTSGSSADNRLSFAFSSFSPVSPPSSPLSSSAPQNHSSRPSGSSPSSSPRLRPSSPPFARRHSASGGSSFLKPNLTPEQLVDLARQSSAPRYVHGSTGASHPSSPSNPDATAASISPATFTLLPLDVYLPFIDRAAETAHLLSIPPTKKLLSLLAQTFPAQTHEEMQDPFTVDPFRWTFPTLRRWLTEVDRSSANDAVWVGQARKCVLAHSELIWERLKGALGVPPELELEDLDTSHFIDPADSPPTLSHPEDEPSPDSVALTSSPEPLLTIEPILATLSSIPPPSTPGVSNPPPSSLPAGLSHSASKSQVDQVLQDIVEDREEEEEIGVNTGDKDRIKLEDDPKAQIHGLRVCTSPIPSSAAVTPQVFSHPSSPTMTRSMNVSGRNGVEPRSPDFSQFPLTRRLSRTSSRHWVQEITLLGKHGFPSP